MARRIVTGHPILGIQASENLNIGRSDKYLHEPLEALVNGSEIDEPFFERKS
jgi:hypothetical protein